MGLGICVGPILNKKMRKMLSLMSYVIWGQSIADNLQSHL